MGAPSKAEEVVLWWVYGGFMVTFWCFFAEILKKKSFFEEIGVSVGFFMDSLCFAVLGWPAKGLTVPAWFGKETPD